MKNNFTLVTLYIVGFISYASFTSLIPSMPFYAREIGASVSQVGLVLAIYSYVTAALLIPFGLLADKTGRRNLLVAALVVFTVAPLLYPLTTSPLQLIVVRAIHGMASAASPSAAFALVVDLAPAERRGESLGWYMASTHLGMMAGPIIGGFLFKYFSFEGAFYGCSAFSALGLIFILFRFNAIPQKSVVESAGDNSWSWLKKSLVIAGFVTPLFIYFSTGVIATYIPLYVKGFGIDEVGAGFIATALFASSALLRAPAGRLSDKVGRKPVIISGFVMSAVAVALISQFHGLPQLIPTALLFGIGMGIAAPAGMALVADLASAGRRGLAMSMALCSLHGGIAIGPSVMGVVAESGGYELMFLASAAITAFGLLLFLGLARGQ